MPWHDIATELNYWSFKELSRLNVLIPAESNNWRFKFFSNSQHAVGVEHFDNDQIKRFSTALDKDILDGRGI